MDNDLHMGNYLIIKYLQLTCRRFKESRVMTTTSTKLNGYKIQRDLDRICVVGTEVREEISF